MKRILLALATLLWAGLPAAAQVTCPTFTFGLVLTAGQWQACFDAKQNALGYTPVNKAGDVMVGRLVTTASTTLAAGFNIPHGAAPSAPVNGDLWTTTTGLYVQINGVTVGPLSTTAAPTFTPTVTISGALADQQSALVITSTLPAVPTNQQNGVNFTITSAGTAAQTQRGMLITLAAGYTGSTNSQGLGVLNSVAGTASTLIPAAGSVNALGNMGIVGNTGSTTTGLNVGVDGIASGGNINVGLLGLAQNAKNSATNIGVVGSAINTGSSPVMVGGWFSLNQTTVPTVSAGLIADNGAQALPVALFQVNGVTKTQITSAGVVDITGPAGSGVAALIVRPDNATGINFVVQRSAGGGGTVTFGTSSNHNLTFMTNATEWMSLSATGTFLIGTSTSRYTQFTQSAGAVTASQFRYDDSALHIMQQIQNNGVLAAGQGATINFEYGTGGVATGTAGRLYFPSTDTWAAAGNRSAQFQVDVIQANTLTPALQLTSTAFNTNGYARFGSLSAPTNTTAGDVTGIRFFGTSVNLVTITQPAAGSTLTILNGKTFTVNKSITLDGTDSTTMTFPSVSATIPRTVASGAKALATGAISSATCTSAQTASATGTLTSDAIEATFSADPTGTVGYQAATTGMLTIMAYPTADTVNFKVCNNTGSSITPGAVTLNWAVLR